MKVAVDIGSNTIRMLVGNTSQGRVIPYHYYREITRLGSNGQRSLHTEAIDRSLETLGRYAQIIDSIKPDHCRIVATEAVRRAENRQDFLSAVYSRTGLKIEIIDGSEEADLSFAGVFSALQPSPVSTLIFDIGGGSTGFIVSQAGVVLWRGSYPLGVIALAEDPDHSVRRITDILEILEEDLCRAGLAALVRSAGCEFIGTAGSVTTLAAVDLVMDEYQWQKINNHALSLSALQAIHERIRPLSPALREDITGIEKGRGDLILPGAEIVLSLLHKFDKNGLRVSDFGLLEGIMLSMP